MPDASQSVPLLLVHNVGRHAPDAIKAIVSTTLSAAGVEKVSADEFNWDRLVPQRPRTGRITDYADLSTLGRAFWTAAWIGVEEDTIPRWRM